MYRFTIYAIPLLLILLALFGFVVDAFDLEPQGGGIVKLTLFGSQGLPTQVVFGAWLLEAIGLLTLYLLAQGRVGFWWLDGLVTGWIAWVFRGPLLVITIVTATGQRQDLWWTIALGWWVLYSICGLSLAILARRSWLRPALVTGGYRQSRARAVEDEDVAPEKATVPLDASADEASLGSSVERGSEHDKPGPPGRDWAT